MIMNKNKVLAVTCVAVLSLLFGCGGAGSNSDRAGAGGSGAGSGYGSDRNQNSTNGESVDSGSKFFYFSYDDSASTAAVELVKYQLNHNTLPSSSLARPWEFFNYESFDPSGSEPFGIFNVSMGLLSRPTETSGESEYHLGVHVTSPEITLEGRQNVVLTLVVDVSGSMSELSSSDAEISSRKLDVAKYGLNQLAASLKEGDIINLVTFSDSATIVLKSVPYSQIATSFVPAVNNLKVIASTNLDDGLQKGYEAALSTLDQTKLNRVVMITDAYANTGQVNSTIISQNTRINELEGIYFSGIGMGANFNEAFLNELTEAGKGAYFTVITNHDAQRAFQDRFIALVSVAARHVRFKLDFPETWTHTTSAAEQTSTVATDVSPTNFSYNTSQYFYEVFSGPSDTTRNFTLTATYTDPVTNQEITKTLTKAVGELLGLQENNIRDAETVFLFTGLLGARITKDKINNIITTHYSGYSSVLFTEYTGLMNKYLTISGQTPLF